ncbi:MAG TPA: hypothetical protein VF005_04630, partial [Acidimicrobiales bacterium]
MAIDNDRKLDKAGPGGRPDEEAGPGGQPDDDAEVVAAIAAAVELVGPRPGPAPPARLRARATPAWRFSGRWWSKPPQL